MLIGALMIVAAALLVSAFLTGTTALAGAALVVSLGAAALYIWLLRRAPSTGSTSTSGASITEAPTPEDSTSAAEPGRAEPAGTDAVSTPAEAPDSKAEEPSPAPAPAQHQADPEASQLDGATVVHVVPGRLRYHVDGCEVLDGRDVEDLTVDDARDEGFTACSRCAARGRSPATA